MTVLFEMAGAIGGSIGGGAASSAAGGAGGGGGGASAIGDVTAVIASVQGSYPVITQFHLSTYAHPHHARDIWCAVIYLPCLIGTVLFGQMSSASNLTSVVELTGGLQWATL